MLDHADRLFSAAGVSPADVVRVDVPAKGTDRETASGALRAEVEPVVPALQSGSLFGGRSGLLVVDVQHLLVSEAELLAELLAAPVGEAMVVLVSSGAVPASLARVIRERGQALTVKKLRERDAADWLAGEINRRGLKLGADAARALLQRFGSDVSGLSRALDQLASSPGAISRRAVLERFKNRPDEPMWHFADAVSDGDVGEALRRLADFWTHGHPLQLLGFLENDLRQRSLAAAAPDLETFAGWVGRSPKDYPVRKAWQRRGASSDTELRSALDALRRTDQVLKTAPAEVQRLTMERLTVALCRWYGRKARRAG
jgi:DNA polymerase III delta subunit